MKVYCQTCLFFSLLGTAFFFILGLLAATSNEVFLINKANGLEKKGETKSLCIKMTVVSQAPVISIVDIRGFGCGHWCFLAQHGAKGKEIERIGLSQ